MRPPGPVEPAELQMAPRGGGKPASSFYCACSVEAGTGFATRTRARIQGLSFKERAMLQDIPTPVLREARPCVLETERLRLRRPTLADVKAITRLANDRRIAENTRRLPHPYLQDHAVEFVRALADDPRETVFLIENNFVPIGVVGVDWRQQGAPELG